MAFCHPVWLCASRKGFIMHKLKITILFFLMFLLTSCTGTEWNQMQERKTSGKDTEQKGEVSLDQTIVASGGAVTGGTVHAADYVTPDMQTPDFWIGRTMFSEKVLMSVKEIADFNEKTQEQMKKEDAMSYYDLPSFGTAVKRETLCSWMERTDFTKETYYDGMAAVTQKQWAIYKENCNTGKIAEDTAVRYGVVWRRADLRELPTETKISPVAGDSMHDVLQNTALAVNEPVLILHESKDKEWYYVISQEYTGWIKKADTALCRDKKEWMATQENKRFIVVTGDKVVLEKNPYNPMTSERELTMGTRLSLAERGEYGEVIDGRSVKDNYVVKVPAADAQGNLVYHLALVPAGRDVHKGYLEYTKAAVIRQAFKMLGNLYGWGGMYDGRDCSSMVRDIYRCFGFRFPRNSDEQAMLPSGGKKDLSSLSDEEKKQELNEAEPGTILQMSGHIMIYLGCVDHRYYVISASGGYLPENFHEETMKEEDYMVRSVTVNTLDVVSPSNQKTWLSQLKTMITIP